MNYLKIIPCTSHIFFPFHPYVRPILNDHVTSPWRSPAFPCRSRADVDWSRAELVSFAEMKQLREEKVYKPYSVI